MAHLASDGGVQPRRALIPVSDKIGQSYSYRIQDLMRERNRRSDRPWLGIVGVIGIKNVACHGDSFNVTSSTKSC
jgi:hypothetical protein